MSASMYVSFRLVPCKSALLAISCEHVSLGRFGRHDHYEGFCASGAMVCPLLVTPTRRFGGYAWSEHIDVYAFSRGTPPKIAVFMGCGEYQTHGRFLGNLHELWSKQHNGKVSLFLTYREIRKTPCLIRQSTDPEQETASIGMV
jgi:hypothetical protein